MRESRGETPEARLIVVDDHAFMRAGIRAILSAQPGFEVVGEAADGEEAIACCRELRPDLVLMDVTMPKMDGITATRSIKAEFPETSVLVLTAHDDHDLLLDAVRAGAAGYVLKNSNPTHVLDAVNAVLGGETPLDQGLAMLSAVADDTRPIVTIDAGPQDHGWVGSSSATFEFSSDVENATFQCSLDGNPFKECSSPKTYNGLSDSVRPDGSAGTIPPHTFRVRALNAVGNSHTPVERTWYVDTTPPTVEIERGPNGAVNTGYYNKTDAGFLWNIYDPNWRRFECSLDGAPFGPCPGNDNYDGFYRNLSDGEHTFRVRSIDSVGNIGEDSRTWVVDTVAPETTIDSGPSGTVSAGSARFALSAGEAGVTLRCKLDDAAFTACNSPQEYTELTNGQHTFSAQATDRAGNVGPVASQSWTIAPDRASEGVVAGGTLTTDDDGEAGATAFDPLETSITSPVAGTVSVVETAATGPDPVGYSFLGQQANITAPSSTPEDPLRFAFRLDLSLLPAGEDHISIEVFRNGIRVALCDDQSGKASPNPCVLSREVLADGDIEVTILTAAASYWNLGVVDRVAPTIESVTPANLARNVSATTNVTATFSEAMKAGTIRGSFVLVRQGTNVPIGSKVSYAAAAKKATLNPNRDLKPGATYVATVKGGAGGATDAVDNPLAANKVWTFTIKRR